MTKRIFRSIMLVSALVLVIGLGFIMGILYHYFGSQIEKELKSETAYLAISVENMGISALDKLPAESARVTLIDEDGTVLFDNKADAAGMENHADRQEVIAAKLKGTGKATRQSDTLAEKTIYYAKQLENGQILRVSSTQYTVAALIGELVQPMLYVLLMMVVLSALFAARISKKIVSPINDLDLEEPERTEAYDEISPLLTKINKQQRTIRKQLSDARRQQQEFSIITENMSEGLLVIDAQTDLLSYNSSALRLLDAAETQAHTSVLSLNRSEPFQQAVDAVLSGRHTSSNLQIGDSFCQVIANPVLRDKEVTGAVLLLVDITEKIQRENLRREFTANVSHELKTPLTSISGFAEIIQDGFVKPEDIKKFAGKIFVEAQRLIALVGDVIKISQLDEGCLPYQKEETDLYVLAKDTLEHLRDPAKRRQVSLFLEGEHAVLATTQPILEEVLYNLCDNAIKYNHPNGKVTVTVLNGKNTVSISVADTGIGIPSADQARVFERFYRVDKSHSKEIGGTGLGLSIVKHGAAYLGAKVELDSQLDKGSVFRLIWGKNSSLS
ncbi:sensor histidine kinase [Blautia producta]|uniref:histidine kinase n=1 Tax=Blautia producta TaxID=33035 RepID=A0A4P6LXP7_9FIRM|nr:ATP-binding protein [Blautia producta]QBE95657.1 Sensor histidine kinase ResE [Blautia producta]